MPIGLVGKKCGMTRVFTPDGASIPVTVIHVEPNYVTQLKTEEKDGCLKVQLSAGKTRPNLVSKAVAGHCAKANIELTKSFTEFPLEKGEEANLKVGDEIKVDIFKDGQLIDVRGCTKGKGFQGGVRRHGYRSRNRSNISLAHRTIGSTGQNQTPGRVFKGKNMPGQMGNVMRTTQLLTLVKVDNERRLLLVKGAIPGAKNSQVIVVPSVKVKQEAN